MDIELEPVRGSPRAGAFGVPTHWEEPPVGVERQQRESFLLPVGIVTLLLADIEGSSTLWEASPSAMASAIARHDALVHELIRRFDGVRPVEQGEGDSFVAAFSRASDAVRCALELQLAFAREAWPSGAELWLRIALHTGEVQLRDEGNYVGQAVNRCARLRDIAHGGQTLLSRSTFELVADRLPEDATVVDLGVHRLKDLARPEHAYQLCHPELRPDFPLLRSLDALPNNLPSHPTSFIGRTAEIAEVRKLLADNRLVTLMGSGGCGKTRLALQVGADALADFADGVWWVDLAPVGDGAHVVDAVAGALGVRELPFQPLSAAVLTQLKGQRLLILLDNCEHVIEGCAELADALLRECPDVTLLATSRQPLGIAGEVAWRVPSMSVPSSEPGPIDALETYEAVRLFIDRASKSRPNFKITNENAPAVVEICQRLDGIPLGVELAAARVRTMTPGSIVEALKDRFRLLTGGSRTALARQQTLRASVDWSHDLLDEGQRLLLRRLAVFAGGFSLDAAEAVCAGRGLEAEEILDLLTQLVDRSLVQLDEQEEEGRYRLLETIRQYGLSRLADTGGEEPWLRANHLRFYLALAEREAPRGGRADVPGSSNVLEREYDNLRAAMDYSVQSESPEEALRLAAALWRFWFLRYSLSEGVARLTAALSLEGGEATDRARALAAAASLCAFLFDFGNGRRFGEEALGLARQLGDETVLAPALHVLGWLETLALNEPAARPLLEECLRVTRATGQDFWRAAAAMGLGVLEVFATGDLPAAIAMFEECRSLADAGGMRLYQMSGAFWLGVALFYAGDLAAGRSLALECLRISDALNDHSFRVHARALLGLVAAAQGSYEEAERLGEQSVALAREVNTPAEFVFSLLSAGYTAYTAADGERALPMLTEAAAMATFVGLAQFSALGRAPAARILALGGERERARKFVAEAREALKTVPNRWVTGLVLGVIAAIVRDEGDLAGAEDSAQSAVAACAEGGARGYLADALERLGGIAAALESHDRAARLFGAGQTLRDATGCVRPPIDAPGYEADVAAARDSLGDEHFRQAFEAGCRLSTEQAVLYATKGRGARGRPSSGWGSLTPAELEVARLIAEGLTNRQIADRLFISAGTVKTHLSSIFGKLGVSTRSELAAAVTRRRV